MTALLTVQKAEGPAKPRGFLLFLSAASVPVSRLIADSLGGLIEI